MKYTKKANGSVVCSFSKEELAKIYNLSIMDVINGKKPREISRLMNDVAHKYSEMEGDTAPMIQFMQANVEGDDKSITINMEPISPAEAHGVIPAFGGLSEPDDWEYGLWEESQGGTVDKLDDGISDLFGAIPEEAVEYELQEDQGLYNVPEQDLQRAYIVWFHSMQEVIDAVNIVGGDEDFFDSGLYKDKNRYGLYLHGDTKIVCAKVMRLTDFCGAVEQIHDVEKLSYMDPIIAAGAYKKLRQIAGSAEG